METSVTPTPHPIRCISFDVRRNPLPVVLTPGYIAPEGTTCAGLRHIGGVPGKILEQRDQHGDDHLVAGLVGKGHDDESLPLVIDQPAQLDRVATLRRKDFTVYLHRHFLSLGLDTLSVTEAGARRKPHPGGGAA